MIGLKTKVGQTDLDRVGPQNPKDDGLTVVRRARRDPEINLGLVHLEFDAAILWNAFLGNVDAGHQFETGKHGSLHPLGKVVPDRTDTVNAIAEHNAVGHRLDVNIGSAVADRFFDDSVHQCDHAGVFSRIHINGLVDRSVNG